MVFNRRARTKWISIDDLGLTIVFNRRPQAQRWCKPILASRPLATSNEIAVKCLPQVACADGRRHDLQRNVRAPIGGHVHLVPNDFRSTTSTAPGGAAAAATTKLPQDGQARKRRKSVGERIGIHFEPCRSPHTDSTSGFRVVQMTSMPSQSQRSPLTLFV